MFINAPEGCQHGTHTNKMGRPTHEAPTYFYLLVESTHTHKHTQTHKSTARPDKVRCGLTPGRPIPQLGARSLPTSCKLYWDARRDYKKGMVQLSLGLLLLLAVVGEALWASPGVARSATGFSLTARPASPPRPLPPLKENL